MLGLDPLLTTHCCETDERLSIPSFPDKSLSRLSVSTPTEKRREKLMTCCVCAHTVGIFKGYDASSDVLLLLVMKELRSFLKM